MRGGNMNGKYPGRGASYRGSPTGGNGQYGGYYHDSYYSSSPISRRGGSRGRNSSAGGYYGSTGLYSNISYIPPSSSSSNPENSNPNADSNTNNNINNIDANPINGHTSMNGNEHSTNSYVAPSSGSDSTDYQNNESFESNKWSGHYSSDYLGRGRGGYKFARGGGNRGRGRGGISRGGWGLGRGGGNAGYYYNNNNFNVVNSGTVMGYEGVSNKQAQWQYYNERDGNLNNRYDTGMYNGNRGVNVESETVDTSLDPHQRYHEQQQQQQQQQPQKPIQSNDHINVQKELKRKQLEEENKLQKERDLVRERERELEQKKEADFKEKHWISRIHAHGELKQNLIKCFNELDTINSNLLDLGTRRVELEMDINRYNRILKGEDDRVRLAEEHLESMNLTI